MSAPNAATSTVRLKCLTGRRVFITGCATGIGASIVRAFASQGADIAFIDIAGEPAEALARSLLSSCKVWWSQCDVRDVGALQRCIRARHASPVRSTRSMRDGREGESGGRESVHC